VPGVLIVRPDAPLFYANALMVREAIEQAVAASDHLQAVVLLLEVNDELDITTVEQFGKLNDDLHANGVPLLLTHVHDPVRQIAERSGLLSKIGPDHLFATTPAAVEWAKSCGA